jgi:hypothetical protein
LAGRSGGTIITSGTEAICVIPAKSLTLKVLVERASDGVPVRIQQEGVTVSRALGHARYPRQTGTVLDNDRLLP